MSENSERSLAAPCHSPKELLAVLERSKSAIAMALPKHLNPDRMLRLALTAFSTTPALRQCTGQSILSSIVVASQLGLEPGIAGQGYLIPYKSTCTFVPGWQGLVGLLNNSGRATAWTGCVFDGDLFDFELGSNPHITHRPGPNFGDQEKLVWVYACGKVNGSEMPVIEAWPISRVWKHRDRFNKVGRSHYSFSHPEMYARKVVLLQVLKYMPRSVELNNALVAANAAEIGNSSIVGEGGVVIEVESESVIQSGAPTFPAPRAEQQKPNPGPAAPRPPRNPRPPQSPPPAAPPVPPAPPELPADEEPALPGAEPEVEPAPAPVAPQAGEGDGEGDDPLPMVVHLVKTTSGVDSSEVVRWLVENRVIPKAPPKISDLPREALALLVEKWQTVVSDIRGD